MGWLSGPRSFRILTPPVGRGCGAPQCGTALVSRPKWSLGCRGAVWSGCVRGLPTRPEAPALHRGGPRSRRPKHGKPRLPLPGKWPGAGVWVSRASWGGRTRRMLPVAIVVELRPPVTAPLIRLARPVAPRSPAPFGCGRWSVLLRVPLMGCVTFGLASVMIISYIMSAFQSSFLGGSESESHVLGAKTVFGCQDVTATTVLVPSLTGGPGWAGQVRAAGQGGRSGRQVRAAGQGGRSGRAGQDGQVRTGRSGRAHPAGASSRRVRPAYRAGVSGRPVGPPGRAARSGRPVGPAVPAQGWRDRGFRAGLRQERVLVAGDGRAPRASPRPLAHPERGLQRRRLP